MDSEGAEHATTIRRLVGVYNANGTLAGELAYVVGSRLGRAHCALCDITHGRLRTRPEWNTCRAGLPVPFDTYHLNDQPARVQIASDGAAPVVLVETDDEFAVLLDPDELAACAGSVDALSEALERAVSRRGLLWPD